jgi:hypothetical protein
MELLPPFSCGKEFYSISVIEGWPFCVHEVMSLSNRAERESGTGTQTWGEKDSKSACM